MPQSGRSAQCVEGELLGFEGEEPEALVAPRPIRCDKLAVSNHLRQPKVLSKHRLELSPAESVDRRH